MEFAELQTFVMVAEERSFSRAAVRLCRTQPAVSMAVRRLEEQVGEQLFDRATKAPELTPAGEVLLGYASRLFALRDEAQVALRDLRGLRRGGLVIGANEALAPALLPVIEQYRASHPEIQVDVRRVRRGQIEGGVLLGDLDFGITPAPPADEALERAPMASDEVVVLVPPSHRLAGRPQLRVAELAWEVLVVDSEPSAVRDGVQALLERSRTQPRIGLALPSLDAVKRAVERGMGVTLLPRSSAVTEIAHGRLVAVHLAEAAGLGSLWLSWARRPLTPAAQAFLECVRRVASADGAAAQPLPARRAEGAGARGRDRLSGAWTR